MEINSCKLVEMSSGYMGVYHIVGGNVLLDREAAATFMCFVVSINFDDANIEGFQFISEYEVNV